ncbi:hypothetical protein WJX84_005496 [Apatococcus fuscideae]|uniref:Spermatogenesis-associated protein 17 n=1 Tax=Apatococcus fuscideae TaxID=2026836 RepID=A0AAW1T563_9CHLO
MEVPLQVAVELRHAEELSYVALLIKDLFAALRRADAAWEQETSAAIRIQAHARGFLQRLYLGALRHHAIVIQKCWRGYRGSERFKDYRQAYDIILRARFVAAAATNIQRTWRGWLSRKYRHDFFKRKHYLEGVRRTNATVRALIQQQADLSAR